ncbi:MAG: 50S ribosomal protein L25 [Lachnospiraceae bacterium]|nr:50S ribosomal protein L25 [Lachnospiraceae bacterium]
MNTLKAEKRSMDVKAKKLRREGYVTGNLFGKKLEGSIPVKMTKTDVARLMKTNNKGSQIMLDVEGESYDVLIKDVEFNSQLGHYDEIDFQALVSDEKVQSVAEIVIVGYDKVVEGVLQENLKEIAYKALPKDLFDKVQIDVSEMKVGDTIRVKDLDMAKNTEIGLLTDLEAAVVTVSAVHAEEKAAEPEEAEAETTEA